MSEKISFEIDVLRVAASQCVLFGHCFSLFGITTLKDQTYFPYIQNIGVVLLFVISGFLFTNSIDQRGDITFKQYFVKRLIRIKIPYLGAMAVITVLSMIMIRINAESFEYYDSFNVGTMIGNYLMLQNYPLIPFMNRFMGTNLNIVPFSSGRPFWTLSIEWWIYMLAGYFWLSLRPKQKVRVIDLVLLFFFAIVPLYNLLLGRGNCLALIWLGGGNSGSSLQMY